MNAHKFIEGLINKDLMEIGEMGFFDSSKLSEMEVFTEEEIKEMINTLEEYSWEEGHHCPECGLLNCNNHNFINKEELIELFGETQ